MHDFLFIKNSGEYLKLPFAEIVYIEAVNKYVKIIAKKKYYLIPTTMNNIEKMLPHTIFRRIHRSYIISLHHANKFDNNGVYIDSKKLPIGKSYKESLLVNIIVLSTDVKSVSKLSNGDINKLLNDINPQ